MSEERLQEIKDSINLQYKVQEANDLHSFNIFTDEEQELVEEVERLQQRIDKALNKLEEIVLYDEYITIHTDFINDTKEILKGSDK